MRLYILLLAGVLLAACGDDDSAESEKSMTEKAESMVDTMKEEGKEMMEEVGSETEEGMKVVDHTLDEAEFELKRSINGLERMIEQYKEEGYDTADLEEQKKQKEKELENL